MRTTSPQKHPAMNTKHNEGNRMIAESEAVKSRTIGDYDVWYKPCEKCGYDTGKSEIPKDGNKRCWKCGNYVKRDFSDRALKATQESYKNGNIHTVTNIGTLHKMKRINYPSEYGSDLKDYEWVVKWDDTKRGIYNRWLPLHPNDDFFGIYKVGESVKFYESTYCDIRGYCGCAILVK